MPCACQVPVPSYPETADWGPILWRILHGLAEKAGKGIIHADELREWQKFMKLTGEFLPCEKCRDHYRTFLKKHQLKSTATNTELNGLVKSFYWNLHNEVNISREAPIYSYNDLATAYETVNFTDVFHQLNPIVKKAILLSGVHMMAWVNWVNSFKMLRSILGI